MAYVFNGEETERLQKTLQQLADPLELTLFQKQESEFGRKLERVAGEISRLSHGKARIVTSLPEPGLPAPCFKMGSSGRANIIYGALPTGHEFRPFIRALDFSKRLGALAVIEMALDRNPDTVRTMMPLFLPLLSHHDARIRGDVSDMLGRIGDPRAIAGLEPLKADPDPDVAEAAAEAIADLRKQRS